VQIEYLKRAIALNREDTNVRRMLASLYFNAGMNREAITQYREILVLKAG
jgi:cytochrome c-type biogenesis protein CcmH/NrfG